MPMEPVYFIMAIMGCGDDGGACRQQRVEPVRYESVAQCKEAMSAALLRNTDLEFPLIEANCRRNTERIVQNDPKPQG